MPNEVIGRYLGNRLPAVSIRFAAGPRSHRLDFIVDTGCSVGLILYENWAAIARPNLTDQRDKVFLGNGGVWNAVRAFSYIEWLDMLQERPILIVPAPKNGTGGEAGIIGMDLLKGTRIELSLTRVRIVRI